MAVAVVVCAAAAALALFAASRTWLTSIEVRAAPLAPVTAPRAGASLVPALPALALVALAGAGAIIATRGRSRLVVGGLLVGAGVGMGAAAASALGTNGLATGWAVVSVVMAGLVVAVGVVTLRRGQVWPSMGERYERGISAEAREVAAGVGSPAGSVFPNKTSDVGLWDAIDRGEDPTKS